MITLRIQLAAPVLITLFLLPSCGPFHAKQVGITGESRRLTVGTVQREIRKGMSGAGVIEVLGSPNVVSTDENGREVWVYDRFSTDVVASESVGTLILLSGSARARSTSQRTLTVIIKFDDAKKVREFAYHSSRF